MESYQKRDQPLPTMQEVPEAEAHIQERELEAREWRLWDWEAHLKAREERLNELEDIEQKYLKMVGKAAARRAASRERATRERGVRGAVIAPNGYERRESTIR